ncbi:MAG TPA: cation:dicarboxylase symporter family transporter [Terriglobales bacterium]|nr:cation:dicarboxylase symporter family transporter [Terriglobales bacterium]
MYQRMRRTTTLWVLVLIAGALLAAGSDSIGLVHIPREVLVSTRWLVLGGAVLLATLTRSLITWIFVSMLLGAEVGHDFPRVGIDSRLLAQIFLRLIEVVIAPLVFSTLVSGIAAHSNLKTVGRVGIKAILYFELVTTVALFIGLAAINLSQAGAGAQIPANSTEPGRVQRLSASDAVLNTFPENIAKSVAENHVLQVVVFSLLFAIALVMVQQEERRRPMLAFVESLAQVMFKFTDMIMWFAPLGVFGAIASTVASSGIGVLGNLAKLLLTLYLALAVFLSLVLLPIAVLARLPLRRLVRAIAEPASIAFGTASSEAALPRAMEKMEEFGVPRPIVAFVMPTGYSFNLDGSTLYLSLAAIFVAQASGLHLGLRAQLYLVLVLMLTSKGVAGVSRAAIVVLLATATTVGLPTGPIFLLLGIDQFLDMGRTAVNVIGNCLATAVIARWEGQLKEIPWTPAALAGSGSAVPRTTPGSR